MPRLILVNGPPAAGKSTLARRYVHDHPFALALEIDALRRMLGRWRDDPHRAGLFARELALAAAAAHLAAGSDVLVPQYFGRVDHLERFEQLASSCEAEFAELVLLDTKDVMAARFHARTRAGAAPEHVEANEQLERVGGQAQLEAMYDRLLLVVAARPTARVIPAREGDIDGTYAALLAHVEAVAAER